MLLRQKKPTHLTITAYPYDNSKKEKGNPYIKKKTKKTKKARKGRKTYKDYDFVDDYTKVIDEIKPDMVYLSIPATLHYDIAKDFLANGIIVLSEKPACNSMRELNELYEIAEKITYILKPYIISNTAAR